MFGRHTSPPQRAHRPWIARVAAAALVGATISAPVTMAGPAHAATTSANLILNGDAETGQCSPGGWEETTDPSWQITSGDPVIDCYNSTNVANTTTPGAQGTAYFQGGSRGSSEMTQTVDVSSAATAIDAGGVSSTLSGYLGGVAAYTDAATVTATYQGANGNSLGTGSIGPVTPAMRSNTTELLSQTSTPASTRCH